MALPIAPTPVLTGKSAVALERYMRESKNKREKLVLHKINMQDFEERQKKMMERRNEWRKKHPAIS